MSIHTRVNSTKHATYDSNSKIAQINRVQKASFINGYQLATKYFSQCVKKAMVSAIWNSFLHFAQLFIFYFNPVSSDNSKKFKPPKKEDYEL